MRRLLEISPLPMRILAALTWVLLAGHVRAGDAITPKDFVIERPTLKCLGFRWYADGDGNRNATVSVSYRRKGEADFRKALPLLRINGETAFQTSADNRWVAPNMFAGSILGLEPDTEYEVRLELSDSNGGQAGQA